MERITRRTVVASILGVAVVLWGTYGVFAQQQKPMTLTRIFTASNGQTQDGTVEMKMTASATYRYAEASDTVRVSEAQFLRLPKGQVQDWHNPARRQYVVSLSGRAEVELGNRKKIILDPGRIVLLEDVTGQGHITRSLGPEDLTLFVVPLAAQ